MNNHILKLPFNFDLLKLSEDLNYVKQSDWVRHPNVKAYDGSWMITSLYSIDGTTNQVCAFENQHYYPTPLIKKMTYIPQILKNFKTEIEAVRLMNLAANSSIKEHCDRGSSFEEGYARLHIPITTNEKVSFILNGYEERLEKGECYYINAHKPHSVDNFGATDRIHLLIDCKVNDWLKELFYQQGFEPEKKLFDDSSINNENINQIINNLKLLNTPAAIDIIRDLEQQKALNNV